MAGRLKGGEARAIAVGLLFTQQKGRCYLCGGSMGGANVPSNNLRPTLDQIVPRAQGGVYEWGNVALAHDSCNRGKADRSPKPCECLFGEAMGKALNGACGWRHRNAGAAWLAAARSMPEHVYVWKEF